jgi:hypothetical protein
VGVLVGVFGDPEDRFPTAQGLVDGSDPGDADQGFRARHHDRPDGVSQGVTVEEHQDRRSFSVRHDHLPRLVGRPGFPAGIERNGVEPAF